MNYNEYYIFNKSLKQCQHNLLNLVKKVFGFLVGQVMKASVGKADPKRVGKMIEDELIG